MAIFMNYTNIYDVFIVWNIGNTGVQNRNEVSSRRTNVSVKIWATNTYIISNTDIYTYLTAYKYTE